MPINQLNYFSVIISNSIEVLNSEIADQNTDVIEIQEMIQTDVPKIKIHRRDSFSKYFNDYVILVCLICIFVTAYLSFFMLICLVLFFKREHN